LTFSQEIYFLKFYFGLVTPPPFCDEDIESLGIYKEPHHFPSITAKPSFPAKITSQPRLNVIEIPELIKNPTEKTIKSLETDKNLIKNIEIKTPFEKIQTAKNLYLDDFQSKIINDLTFFNSSKSLLNNKTVISKQNVFIKMKSFLEDQISLKISEVFAPTSFFRFIFNFIILLLTNLYFILIPFEISFNVSLSYEIMGSNLFNSFALAMFLFEIFLNFNTFYYSQGELVDDFQAIRLKYFKNLNFFKDFLSLTYLFASLFSYDIQKFSIFGLLFYFRVKNCACLQKKIEDFLILDRKTIKPLALIQIVHKILLFVHISACFWYLTSDLSKNHELLNWIDCSGLSNESLALKYFESLYFISFFTNNRLNNQKNPELNTLERGFCLIFSLFTLTLFAYFLKEMIFFSFDSTISQLSKRKQMKQLSRYFKDEKIDKNLQFKIKSYFVSQFKKEPPSFLEHDPRKLINLLSPQLKEEFFLNLNKSLFKSVPFLQQNFSKFSLKEILHLIKENKLAPGEVIYKEKDMIFTPKLHFIKDGEVELYRDNMQSKKSLKILKSGDFFGEVSFFKNTLRETFARALSNLTIFSLDRNEFLRVLKNNEEDFETFCMIRDKIQVYENHKDIQVSCVSCGRFSHSFEECPKIILTFDKKKILKNYLLLRRSTQDRNNYKRKINKNSNARKNFLKNLSASPKEGHKNEEEEFFPDSESSEENIQELILRNSFVSIRKEKKKFSDLILEKEGQLFSSGEFELVKSYNKYFPHNNVENVLNMANERRQKIIHFHQYEEGPSKTYSAPVKFINKNPNSEKTYNSTISRGGNQLKLKAAYMKIRAFLSNNY